MIACGWHVCWVGCGVEDGRGAWRNFWVDGKGSNILSVVLVTWVHCTIYNVVLNKLSYLGGEGVVHVSQYIYDIRRLGLTCIH